MGLTKPNQKLRRDFKGIASDLKWSAVELMRIAERLSMAGNEVDAQAALKMCTVLHAGEDRLAGYADEVKAGNVAEKTDNKSSPEPGFSFLGLSRCRLLASSSRLRHVLAFCYRPPSNCPTLRPADGSAPSGNSPA